MIYIEYENLPSFNEAFNGSFQNGNGEPKTIEIPKTKVEE